jgi:ribosomal protein L37E
MCRNSFHIQRFYCRCGIGLGGKIRHLSGPKIANDVVVPKLCRKRAYVN